ncbi:VWA domain-containing protein [Sorangium sp. So ce854]|uniref:VWA domain-containing protein n=1 Tax=Sorangium sp. So ce854 TaxID=3133322 RepID=UPI003F64438E
MENRSMRVALAAAGICVLFAACGGSSGSVFGGGTGGGDASGSGSGASAGTGDGAGAGSASSSSTGYGNDDVGGPSAGPSSGSGEGAGGDMSCAGETSTAELVPLDLYIMLDASGSMDERISTSVSKWEAVTEALEAFFTDPQSAGIGVGLQYFPLRDPDVPATCTENSQCGANGPCAMGVCRRTRPTAFCSSNADCPSGDTCLDLGRCSVSGVLCAPPGGTCPSGGGTCRPVTESECANPYSCNPDVYAAPAVAITPLDDASAAALVTSIAQKEPLGGTPTAGALAGALQQARAHAEANPTHRVVTVLATDGMPTDCDPVSADGIAQIASEALAGTPSISTFVIGVFDGDDDGAQATMDRIAEGGGTTSAFFIDTSTDVTQAFLDALTAIRGQSLACEYQVPAPSAGQTLDYGTLNVEHTRPQAGDPTTIFYVSDEASCDAAAGGWYYDVDPATGGTPTKIVMCPATCTQFREGGQVALRVGCKTEVPPIN